MDINKIRWLKSEEVDGSSADSSLDSLFPSLILPVGWTAESKILLQNDKLYYLIKDTASNIRGEVYFEYDSFFLKYTFTVYLYTRYDIRVLESEKGMFRHIYDRANGDAVVHSRPYLKETREEFFEWMRKTYPKWQNPHAYWDD